MNTPLFKKFIYFWTAEVWIHLFLFIAFLLFVWITDHDMQEVDHLTFKVVALELIIALLAGIHAGDETERNNNH